MVRAEFESMPDFVCRQRVPLHVGSGYSDSLVASPGDEDECRRVLEFCRLNRLSVCPRGSGRSYGDAILNDDNVILDMSRMKRILEFDDANQVLTVQAGTPIVDIFARYHHLGYAVAASPTDSTISVGGALGANVNGKDSWRVGNFGDQVVSMKIMLASGEVLVIDRDNHGDLFLAAVGGMGLIGLVLEVSLQLIRIPSPYLDGEIFAANDVPDLIRKLDEIRDDADFIVAWVDGYATGDAIGRSVIHATWWADRSRPDEELRRSVATSIELLAVQKRRALGFYRLARPLINLGFQLQRIPVLLFNEVYFRKNKRRRTRLHDERFMEHNFDKSYVVPPPDILCGPRGFTIQITVPRNVAKEAMTEMLGLCSSLPCPPVTTILRLHRKDDFLISFSEDGYSLNVEIHPKRRHAARVRKFLEEFIDCGIRFGSKVHLPKDNTLTPEQFRSLFPKLDRFLAIKRMADPNELFQSDMYRRLFRPS